MQRLRPGQCRSPVQIRARRSSGQFSWGKHSERIIVTDHCPQGKAQAHSTLTRWLCVSQTLWTYLSRLRATRSQKLNRDGQNLIRGSTMVSNYKGAGTKVPNERFIKKRGGKEARQPSQTEKSWNTNEIKSFS